MEVIVVTIRGDSGRDTRFRLFISNRMTENSIQIIEKNTTISKH